MFQAVSLQIVDDARLLEEVHRLRGEAGSEKGDERARHREQAARRNRHQAEIGDRAHGDAGDEAEQRTDQEIARGRAASGGKTIEEQRDLRALAHHRDGDDDRQRDERARAAAHLLAELARLGRELAPVARHPDVVPGEHADGEAEDRGVEQLLADAVRAHRR